MAFSKWSEIYPLLGYLLFLWFLVKKYVLQMWYITEEENSLKHCTLDLTEEYLYYWNWGNHCAVIIPLGSQSLEYALITIARMGRRLVLSLLCANTDQRALQESLAPIFIFFFPYPCASWEQGIVTLLKLIHHILKLEHEFSDITSPFDRCLADAWL